MLKETIKSIVKNQDFELGKQLLLSDKCEEVLAIMYENHNDMVGRNKDGWLDYVGFFVPLMSDELAIREATTGPPGNGIIPKMMQKSNQGRFEGLWRKIAKQTYSELPASFVNVAQGYVKFINSMFGTPKED